jgi:hypothetical protein
LSGYVGIRIQFGRLNLIRIRIRKTDPDPGGPKWPTKVKKIQVLWKDKDFSGSLDVLYGNLGISKLQFLIKDNINFISGVFIFFLQIFGHQNLESLLKKKCWVPIRIQIFFETRADPQHRYHKTYFSARGCHGLFTLYLLLAAIFRAAPCFVSFFVYTLLFICFVFRYCPTSRLLMTVKINKL